MADSIVGRLRVLLGLDTADFDAGAERAKGKAKGLASEMSALGKVLGVSLGVGSFVLAIKKVADYAGELNDLSAQTGLTTTSLQQMSHAAKQTGASLEDFTNAAFKLGVNLAGGGNSVEAAVKKLGLSYAALMALTPDEQFRTIAAALGQVEDAQQRNKIAVDLFGKAAKQILPAIAEGYDQLADSAHAAGQNQISALDKAGDALSDLKDDVLSAAVLVGGTFVMYVQKATIAWGEFLQALLHTKESQASAAAVLEALGLKAIQLPKVLNESAVAAGNLPGPLKNSSMSAEELAASTKKLDDELEISVERNKAAAEAAKEFAESLKELSGTQAAAGAKNVLKQLEALGGPLNVLPSQLKEMADQLREGAQAALLAGNANLAGQYTLLAKTLDPVIQFQQRFNVTIGEYAQEASDASDFTQELSDQLNRLGGTVITIGPLLESKLDLSKMFERFKAGVKANNPFDPDKMPTNDWGAKIFEGIAQGILKAISGGGDVLRTIGATIGRNIGKGVSDNFSDEFKDSLLGKVLSDLLPGLGTLMGPLLEKLGSGLKKLFGIGINDEIKKFNKQIDDSKQKLLEQFGSLQEIDRLGKIVGVDLAGAWKSQGEAGKKHFDELAKAFEAAMDKMVSDAQHAVDDANSSLSDLRSELDGAIGDARELGYEFDKTGKFTGVNFDKLKEKADEFGVSVDGLGPTFRQQGIDAEAKRIIDGFELMAKAGGDVGGILVGMKDEIGKLVGKSIELGTTVPSNMKPWIQNLIDTHQLLDENGKEITDIGKIKFGDPIKTQFEEISAKIDTLLNGIAELVDKITHELIPALEAATRDRNVHIGVTSDPIPQYPGTIDGGGGDNGGGSEPGFALGTKARFGSWFGNFPQSGFNTALHGVEAVVRQDEAVPFAMDVMRGLSSGAEASAPTAQQPQQVHVALDNRIILDGREIKSWYRDTLLSSIDNNEDGFRTELRDGIGVAP